VLGAALPKLLAGQFERMTPLVRWLNASIGYPPAKSRL
jgi:hypothetical protein